MEQYILSPYTPFTGYPFNAMTRITQETGVKCLGFTSMYDEQTQERRLIINMESALDTPTLSALEVLVASTDISIPPTPVYMIKIKDLWEYRNDVGAVAGEQPVIYFTREDAVGDEQTHTDTIQLHFTSALNNQQKNSLRGWFSDLIKSI